MLKLPVTVVVPTIPPRKKKYLARALASIEVGEWQPESVIVEQDYHKEGAAVTRNRGLMQVATPWVAFLDDDDEFLPQHLPALFTVAMETGADYVYSWYEVGSGGTDPRPEHFGKPFDSSSPIQTTITTLVDAELAKATGFLPDEKENLLSPDRHYAGEDWRFTQRCVERGAKIVHHPEKTWIWHHHGSNTSGLPRW